MTLIDLALSDQCNVLLLLKLSAFVDCSSCCVVQSMLAASVTQRIESHRRGNRNEFSNSLIDSDFFILLVKVVDIIIIGLWHVFLWLPVS